MEGKTRKRRRKNMRIRERERERDEPYIAECNVYSCVIDSCSQSII